VNLDASGDPVHTRALGVTLAWRADGRLDARGQILDLRKRGFVPIVGDLRPSGIVHHMRVHAVIDPVARRLDAIEAEQPAVAFERAPWTRGESCRDTIPGVQDLAPAPLDAAFAKRVGAGIGGPRGCSHVLALVQLLGGSVGWALDRELELHGALRPQAPGRRLFHRELVLDGFDVGHLRLLVAIQQGDLHLAPIALPERPIERFAADRAVRVRVEVDCERNALTSVRAAERWRTRPDAPDAWRSHAAALAGIEGLGLRAGVTAELLRRLGDEGSQRPLLEALLQLTPAVQQSLAGLEALWQTERARAAREGGVGSHADACYMWRSGGALDLLRRRGTQTDPRPDAEAER
jgi:hypothetical protein